MKVAARLAKLLDGSGVHLLHDRRVPDRVRANIDHLAVGPGGVTVIDAKALRGTVRVESVGGLFSPRRKLLKVNGRNCTRLVEGVKRQAEAVRVLLVRNGFDAVEVRCALCFSNVDGLPLLARLRIDEVVIDGPRAIAKLARRAGPVDAAAVQHLARMLDSSLTPA